MAGYLRPPPDGAEEFVFGDACGFFDKNPERLAFLGRGQHVAAYRFPKSARDRDATLEGMALLFRIGTESDMGVRKRTLDQAKALGYPVLDITVDDSETCAEAELYEMNIADNVVFALQQDDDIKPDFDAKEAPLREKLLGLTPEQRQQARASLERIKSAMGKDWQSSNGRQSLVDAQLALSRSGRIFFGDIDHIAADETPKSAEYHWQVIKDQVDTVEKHLPSP